MVDIPAPTSSPEPFAKWLATVAEPVNLKVQHWGAYWGTSFALQCKLGPVIMKGWSKTHQAHYRMIPVREGYSVSFSLQSRRVLQGKVTVKAFALYGFLRLDVRFNLDTVGYIPLDSPAYSACTRGDWLHLRQLIAEGKAHITDQTSFGETFLHVSPRACISATYCTKILTLRTDSHALEQIGHGIRVT
jgi:hypothetical protein